MTTRTKRARFRPAVLGAAIAALALAGCSTGHIGESWQCPLAEGGACDSVAAADPAVPDAAGGAVLGEPLWRVRSAEPETPLETRCEAACAGDFDPFAWLARLFGEGERSAGRAASEESAAQTPSASGNADLEPEAPAPPPAAAGRESRSAEPAKAALPADPGPLQDDPAQAEAAAGDLRTGEVVARIWIAPFVDAGGVYREASHVRVVLEPAGWRLR